MKWFDYCVIRYMPDPKRGEIINLGLIIFTKSGVDVRILPTLNKVRIIDGRSEEEDLEKLKRTLEGIASFADNVDQQHSLLTAFSSSLFFSEKSYFSIDHNEEYEQKIKYLFDVLVKPHPIYTRQVKQSRLHTRLRKKFIQMDIFSKDINQIEQHKVVANYPISESTGMQVDFLVKNGKYHVSEAIDFEVNDTKSKFRETTLKTMAFLESKKILGKTECYFVYSASALI